MPDKDLQSTSVSAPTKLGILQWSVVIAAFVLMVVLRCVFLDSDAYPHLSWSSALLTDEGFYVHNARNLALFGHLRTDEWNNMLIMPTLHLVQCIVFSRFGVGIVQARAISVGCGIISIALFGYTMRKCFGNFTAAAAVLFFGLGHTNLLYNRLALMDTPAALGMVCAFALWVSALDRIEKRERGSNGLLFALGLVLAGTYATRGLAVWLAPVPLGLMLLYGRQYPEQNRSWIRRTGIATAGLVSGLAVYAIGWYVPNRAELAAMNRYYLAHQLAPHSLNALRGNVTHALFGDYRGLFPYLFRHSPVEFGLILGLLAACLVARGRAKASNGGAEPALLCDLLGHKDESGGGMLTRTMAGRFLIWWLLMAWLVYGTISYAPDRYYVLFYPAMAALAAISLNRLHAIRDVLAGTWLQTIIAALMAYHCGEAFLHHDADLQLALFVIGVTVLFLPYRNAGLMNRALGMVFTPGVLLTLWIVVNGLWTADWLQNIRYAERDAGKTLAATLPDNAVLIGDVAPALSTNSSFPAVNVIPGLCNYKKPLEGFAGRPKYIVILDGRFLEPYWKKQFPSQIREDHRVALFPAMLGKYSVRVYRVDSNL